MASEENKPNGIKMADSGILERNSLSGAHFCQTGVNQSINNTMLLLVLMIFSADNQICAQRSNGVSSAPL